MKRVLAILLSLSLCICLMSGVSFAKDDESALEDLLQDKNVQLAADLLQMDVGEGLLGLLDDSLLEPYVEDGVLIGVTIDCEGEIAVANVPVYVTDVDEDGALTIADALIITHDDYYVSDEEEDNGFALSDENWIIKLWGVENGGGYGYYVNNVSSWSVLDEIKSGDYLVAYVYKDAETWSDMYTYFTETEVEGITGRDVTLQLMGWGYDEEWNPVNMPVSGAVITIDGEDTDYVTDEEGKVTISFGDDSYYLVSARSDDAILVPPVCDVFLYEAGFEPEFTDIEGHWAEEAILYAASNGYLIGVSDTEFGPGVAVTRAMLVTVLHRLEGEPEASESGAFKDVEADAWYADSVAWAAENEIVKGYDDGTFRPNAPLTRQETSVILFRWAKHFISNLFWIEAVAEVMDEIIREFADLTEFADVIGELSDEELNSVLELVLGSALEEAEAELFAVDEEALAAFEDADAIADWGSEAMAWAVTNGIVTGMTEKTVAPQQTLTRAQLAVMLYRMFEA